MQGILRSRDVTLFTHGDRQPVIVSPAMFSVGWSGGQGVQWVDSGTSERMVTFSSGMYGGFLWMGSDETGDQFLATSGSQSKYFYATMYSGGCIMSTSTYEKYTYASRLGGPLVPLVYNVNDLLFFSLRGRFTKENELDLTADPRGSAFFSGIVAQIPKASNNYFLGIQTGI